MHCHGTGTARYYVTVTGGLEQVAWGEVQEKAPEAELERLERGRVFFRAPDDVQPLVKLRSVENLHAYAGEVPAVTADRSSLELIEQHVRGISLDGCVALYEQVAGPLSDPSFRVTATRRGTHDFNSQEVSAAAGAGVVGRYGWRVDLTGYDLEVTVDVREGTCLVGLRLSPETMSRRSRVEHAHASLKSTVAYCMIRMLGAGVDDLFCDPMCGAGTVLVERAEYGAAGRLVGGDRDERMLGKARVNLAAAGAEAALVQWDARRLPLLKDTVDRVVCNLPWGRRVGSHRANLHIYPGFVRSLAAVLKPGGKAALLTLEKRLLTRLIKRHTWLELAETVPLSLGGLKPSIYLVTKSVGEGGDDH